MGGEMGAQHQAESLTTLMSQEHSRGGARGAQEAHQLMVSLLGDGHQGLRGGWWHPCGPGARTNIPVGGRGSALLIVLFQLRTNFRS